MATKTADPTAVFTDAVIAGVKQSQEVAFSGISLWLDFAGKAFTLPELDAVPFVDQLPSPKAVVESSFGFAEELLVTQKDFALKLADAMACTTRIDGSCSPRSSWLRYGFETLARSAICRSDRLAS